MRKSKPKTLANINDLNPVSMRAWVDLEGLRTGTGGQSQRCHLTQVDKGAETPEPNLESTYIKLKLTLGTPLARDSDGLSKGDIIAPPPAAAVVGEREKVVKEVEEELRLGVESLAMEYSGMFWKDLNTGE